MERRGPSIRESDLRRFEEQLGERLPDAYRAFLLEVNGGRLGEENCQFLDKFVVNTMYSLNDPDDAHRLEVVRPYSPDHPSPDLLYIAYDDGGSRILLGISGEHRGEVWIQDLADPRPEGSNPRVLWHDRRDMEKIADTFDEFLKGLGRLRS